METMPHSLARSVRTFWLWYVILVAGMLAFLLAPGGFAEKSRTVLHGLCAQTPTHSFTFGGDLLPFDGRMTGIYGGSLVTLVSLLARGRLLRWGNPPLKISLTLSAFVAVMAVDGFNSLFLDLGLWHPYKPRNELRLLTGFGTGIALATVLAWLLASSVYRLGSQDAGVSSYRDLGWLWLAFVPYAALVLSGASWLYVPLSALLMLSAWITMAMLALVVVVLAFRMDARVDRPTRLHLPGAVAAIVGLALMLGLASGRMWLESTFGIPSTL
jgi:uncharacterized membrane protein